MGFLNFSLTIGAELYVLFLRLAVHVARMGKNIIYRVYELILEGK